MNEEVVFTVNDTTRGIERVMEGVRKWRNASDLVDERATAIVLTKLEEAAMWSLKMVAESKPGPADEE
jgi:hypothetical protein